MEKKRKKREPERLSYGETAEKKRTRGTVIWRKRGEEGNQRDWNGERKEKKRLSWRENVTEKQCNGERGKRGKRGNREPMTVMEKESYRRDQVVE